jgi:hypothetical protein
MLLEEVYPRLLGVQKSNEEMRNKSDEAKEIVKNIFEMFGATRTKPVLKSYTPFIEIKEDKE